MAPAGVRVACPTCLRDQDDLPLPGCATPMWHAATNSRECLLPPPGASFPASPPKLEPLDFDPTVDFAIRLTPAASYLRADNEALRARLRRLDAILMAAGLNVPSDTEPPPPGDRDTDEGPDIESFRREMAMHWSPPPEAPHG